MKKENNNLIKNAKWHISMKDDEIKNTLIRHIQEICFNIGKFKPDFTGILSQGVTIIAGIPECCEYIKRAADNELINIGELKEDDYIIKKTQIAGCDAVLIAGLNNKSVAYGVFSFFEELGCYFLAGKEVYPENGGETVIPDIDRCFSTINVWRGMFFSFCMVSTSIMSIADYKKLFDRMLRMRMNRIVYYSFENEPVVDYTYKNERKVVGDISRPESGYFSYGRHFTGSYNVGTIKIGREKFKRKIVAPMEFQNVCTSNEALDTGKEFMKVLIREAAKRGIGTWISILPQFVSMNMSKYTRPMPRKNLHWSALVSCMDPVVKEINKKRIENIINSYPELEGIFIGIPEGFYEEPYEESSEYIKSVLPEYEEALELQRKYWGDHWSGDELQRKHIEADIAFSKIAVDAVKIAAKNKSGIRVGIATVCKAYLLTKLHKTLPGNVVFMDIESRSLWTHGGAPLFLFKEMKNRECVIIPRITDDGSQMGMQFNINLFNRDGYCASAKDNGTAGLMMQTLHIRGAEHNIRYLAEGMWNVNLSPDAFYDEYIEKVFGEKAVGKIKEAFMLLEENEEFMGGRGASNMPWNHVPLEIAALRHFKDFDNPYHSSPIEDEFLKNSTKRAAIYGKSIIYLDKAAIIFEKSKDICNLNGKEEIVYLAKRTKAYSRHLKTLIGITELFQLYKTAFCNKEKTKANIDVIYNMAQKVEKSAVETAEMISDCVEHTTDLAILWMINSSMIKGTEILRKFIYNIKLFYEGKEYWHPPLWDELFGDCPYPAHKINISQPADDSLEEPG